MSDEKRISVSRVIDASADEIFDVLTLPERHNEFDGSDMVVSDDRTQRIQAVGDTFTMNMNHESQGGDYQMENHVVAFAENKIVGWAPGLPGQEPSGHKWVYTLEVLGPESTDVTLLYDWDAVEDPDLLAVFPAVSKSSLEESLNQLAAAVA